MPIVCPNCTTSYLLEPASLGPSGRSVRCARCRTVWLASPGAEPANVERVAQASQPASDRPAGKHKPESGEGASGADQFHWTFAPDDGESDQPAPETAETSEAAPAELDGTGQIEPVTVSSAGGPGSIAEAQASFLVPAIEPEAIPLYADAESLASTAENIELVAARRAREPGKSRRRRPKWQLPRLPAAITALAAALFALIGWRAEVVRFVPQTASLFAAIGLPVNLRGLTFANVRTTGEVHEGVNMLIVEGAIANTTSRAVEVPRLRFAIRNGAGLEVYAWTAMPGRTILAPGETVPFRTRLGSPPADGRDVIVRFFNRRDVVAGMR